MTYMSMTLTVSEARASLADLVDRVIDGDEVTLTRHGVPVAVLVQPSALRVRRADGALEAAATLRDRRAKARSAGLRTNPTLSAERAEELIAQIRADRDAR
jgi:prevent-host-death family protein